MAEEETPEAGEAKKKSKLPLLIGLLLLLVGGGGGFYATYSGLVFGAADDGAHTAAAEGNHGSAKGGGHGGASGGKAAGHGSGGHGAEPGALPDVAFVPVNALVISLGPASRSTHLRFTSQLEVERAHEGEVAQLMPRILDVLNGYLRAISISEIEDPAALVRLRAQMLRRIQIVTGEGRVRDLLVTEFVLN